MEALADREPYAADAKKIMEKCAAREITGILAAHSIPNLFYIVTRNPADFKNSRVKVILPNEFLRKMQENKKE